MRRNQIQLLVAWPLFVALAGSLPAAAAVGEAAIVAANSATIDRDVVVVGDVVVEDASAGPTLVPGFELSLERDAVIDGDASADSVLLARGSQVTGDLAYNDRSGSGVAGSETTPLALPVLGGLPAFQGGTPRPDALDVLVPAGSTVVLGAGEYADVQVAEGATLVLTGGLYVVGSIGVTDGGTGCSVPCRTFHYQGPVEVRVAGRFDLGAATFLGPEPGSGALVRDAVFYVGGVNGADGGFDSLPRATHFGQGSEVGGTFYTPNGTTAVDHGTVVVGALLGRDVDVDRDSTVSADSFFANRPPVADPQDVLTNGASPITITLTGSDPDGDDLVFSIASAPSEGSLGSVVQAPAPFPGDPPGCNPGNDPSCVPPDPPRTSATVEYTPATGDDLEDAFSFRVEDPHGASGVAIVRINPGGTDPGHQQPPEPEPAIVASDLVVETPKAVAVTIDLHGDAPCDGECDGIGAAPFVDDVPLTFAVVAGSGPANGTLDTVAQGSDVPRRTASVTYTPDPDFTGADGFTYEACGELDAVVTCDTAVVAIGVAGELAQDQTVSTTEGTAVTITLLGTPGAGGSSGVRLQREPGSSRALVRRTATPRRIARYAAFIDASEVAGNVADADGDGFGDNHNDLPGAVPGVGAAGVDLSGGPGSNGVVRFQIEWHLAQIGVSPSSLESATVRLTTLKGTIDSLDTFFFVGSGPQDGLLTDGDFEAPAEQLAGVVMPVPAVPAGTEGTFSFSVLDELRAALENDELGHFSIQARVDEGLAGGGLARGLQIFTSASGNQSSFALPVLEITTPGVTGPTIQFTVLTLPANGTLLQFGVPITTVPAVLSSAELTYLPNLGFSGDDSFTFESTDFVNVDVGTVFFVITPLAADPCVADGREPGCEPGG